MMFVFLCPNLTSLSMIISRFLPVAANHLYFLIDKIHIHRLEGKAKGENGVSSGSAGKESTCNAGDTGDTGSIPGWGRSAEGNCNLLQYSCLKSPKDRGDW